MHKNSDNLYVNSSVAPCTLQEGLDIWQTDWPLCQGWKCIESLWENSQNPRLKVSNLWPSCEVQGPDGHTDFTHTRCAFAWAAAALVGSKKVLHHHHWKQKENPNFFSHSQACMYLLALFHVMVLHLAKEKHFYYLRYCYYYLRRSMSHFQFSLYSRVTQFLIHRYWHSVLFLVSSLLIPNSQGWWSNFSLDNAIQFSVLTTKCSGAESTNGNSVLVSTELPKMLKVTFILIVLKAFEVNMRWRIPYYEDPYMKIIAVNYLSGRFIDVILGGKKDVILLPCAKLLHSRDTPWFSSSCNTLSDEVQYLSQPFHVNLWAGQIESEASKRLPAICCEKADDYSWDSSCMRKPSLGRRRGCILKHQASSLCKSRCSSACSAAKAILTVTWKEIQWDKVMEMEGR